MYSQSGSDRDGERERHTPRERDGGCERDEDDRMRVRETRKNRRDPVKKKKVLGEPSESVDCPAPPALDHI